MAGGTRPPDLQIQRVYRANSLSGMGKCVLTVTHKKHESIMSGLLPYLHTHIFHIFLLSHACSSTHSNVKWRENSSLVCENLGSDFTLTTQL